MGRAGLFEKVHFSFFIIREVVSKKMVLLTMFAGRLPFNSKFMSKEKFIQALKELWIKEFGTLEFIDEGRDGYFVVGFILSVFDYIEEIKIEIND